MSSFSYFINSSSLSNINPANFTVTVYPQIVLDKDWECAIVGGSLVNSVANVSAALNNTTFRYSPDSGTTWFTVVLPEGTYSTTGLQDQLQTVLDANNQYTTVNGERVYPINFGVNLTFLRVTVQLNPNYEIDFSIGNFYQLIGFLSQIYTGGVSGTTFTAPNNATFTDRGLYYYIYSDVIQGGIQNQILTEGIMKIAPGGDLGSSISLVPTSLEVDYFPVKNKNISSITFMVLDGLGQVANFGGEQTSFQLRFRKIKN
jgi:hypothetical protein